MQALEKTAIFSFITGWLEGITHYVFLSPNNGFNIHRAVPQPLPDWPLILSEYTIACLNGIWNHYRGRINQIGVFKRAEITHNHYHNYSLEIHAEVFKTQQPQPFKCKPENGILAWLLWTQFTALQCRAVCYSWVVSHVSLALDLNLNPEGLTLIEAGRAPLGTAAKLIQTTATPSWCSVSPSLPPPQRTGLRRWAVVQCIACPWKIKITSWSSCKLVNDLFMSVNEDAPSENMVANIHLTSRTGFVYFIPLFTVNYIQNIKVFTQVECSHNT